MKIRRQLYIEVNKGGYGRFRGVEIAVGKRSVFRFELHIYKRDSGFGGFGGYSNFARLGA